jgi:hypothetical protein
LLEEKLDKSGAKNYSSRRLLEMYNNKSVLKAAEVFPSHQGPDPLYARELAREVSPPFGKFDKKIAQNMADLLK